MNKYNKCLQEWEEIRSKIVKCEEMSIGEMISLFDEIERDCISTKEFLYAMYSFYSFEYLNQDKAPLSLDECIKYLKRINE